MTFSRDTVLKNMFNMRTDTVILRYSFAKKFTVTYPDRSEWKNEIFRVSVTDLSGIQMDPKLWHWGGVFGGKNGLVFSLGAIATVFQAEVFAIMAAIRESIARRLQW